MSEDSRKPDTSICEHLEDLARQARSDFQSRYGRPPRWSVAAPGRVELIGGHTDYNEGFVVPMALERYVVAVGDSPAEAPREPRLSLYSNVVDATATFALTDEIPRADDWTDYVRGVAAGFLARGVDLPSLDVAMVSSVPLGGGLSSSAALEVAAATLFEVASGTRLDDSEKARLCQKAEHEYAGVPCGILDQYSSIMGRKDQLMLLDCRTLGVDRVPMNTPDVSVLVVNSNVKHELVGGEYAERRSQCEAAAKALGVPALRDATREQLEAARGSLDSVVYRRARHVISENERALGTAAAARDGDWARAGAFMYASHESARDDYEVSCQELDWLVDLARGLGAAGGVLGSRMSGGGFGGCTVNLVTTEALPAVIEALGRLYQEKAGIEATFLVTRPAQGARVLSAG